MQAADSGLYVLDSKDNEVRAQFPLTRRDPWPV
jgi:hypothetical protein